MARDVEPKSRKRVLTAEEAELWTFAMREAKVLRRLERERRRFAENEHSRANGAEPRLNAEPSAEISLPAKPAPAMRNRDTERKQSAATKAPPPLAQFDDKERRRIARDSDLIEARLDLHGMRTREAHGALRGFLAACAANSRRHVLVITGKGTRAELDRQRDYWADEPGVLRRLVPQWLAAPDLRGLVVSYTAASARHGGEGALYIRLRKIRGAV